MSLPPKVAGTLRRAVRCFFRLSLLALSVFACFRLSAFACLRVCVAGRTAHGSVPATFFRLGLLGTCPSEESSVGQERINQQKRFQCGWSYGPAGNIYPHRQLQDFGRWQPTQQRADICASVAYFQARVLGLISTQMFTDKNSRREFAEFPCSLFRSSVVFAGLAGGFWVLVVFSDVTLRHLFRSRVGVPSVRNS